MVRALYNRTTLRNEDVKLDDGPVLLNSPANTKGSSMLRLTFWFTALGTMGLTNIALALSCLVYCARMFCKCF